MVNKIEFLNILLALLKKIIITKIYFKKFTKF